MWWRRSFEKEKKTRLLSTISRSDCAHTTHGCTCTHRVIDVSKNRTSCEQQSLQKSTPTRITSSPHPSEQCLYVWTDFLHMSVARIQVCVCACVCVKHSFFTLACFVAMNFSPRTTNPSSSVRPAYYWGQHCVCVCVHSFTPFRFALASFSSAPRNAVQNTTQGRAAGAGRQEKDGNFFK